MSRFYLQAYKAFEFDSFIVWYIPEKEEKRKIKILDMKRNKISLYRAGTEVNIGLKKQPDIQAYFFISN
jgi:hypothetical protein